MIKNFNFFDIYGYLIPGVVFITLLWLPYGLTLGAWPAQEWSSALIVLVVAYVVGHVVYNFSSSVLPDKFSVDSSKKLRFPSDAVLDATVPSKYSLKPAVQSKIKDRIQKVLG